MQIKGTAILARQEQIRRMFGKERLRVFMEKMSWRFPEFSDTIFVTSRISLESFLAFQQELIATFFPDDDDPYFHIGTQAAQWAFTEGPYSRMIERRGLTIDVFLSQVPSEIWSKYYDFGAMKISADENNIQAVITGIPVEHPYFVRTISGFMLRSAQLIGAVNPVIEDSPGEVPGSRFFRVRFEGWGPPQGD